MRTEKEIYDALKVLIETCEENEGKCKNCILRNGNNDSGVICNSFGDSHPKLSDIMVKNYENPRIILN